MFNNILTINNATFLFEYLEMYTFAGINMKIFNQLSVVFLAMLMIFATGGIGLYKHYCTCSNAAISTILIEDIDCHKKESPECCSTRENDNLHDCCFNNELDTSTQNKECEDDHNCCSTEYTFLKTDSFNYVITTKKSQIFLLACVFVFKNQYNLDHTLVENQIGFNNNLPPPLFGKELLVSLQQMKISALLV